MEIVKRLSNKIVMNFRGENIGALLLRASTGSFAIKLGGAGIAFFIQIWLARLLEVSQYGIYIYVLAWINFLVLFAKAGMDVAVVRYIPVYLRNKDWGLFRGLISDSLSKVLLFSTCISVLIILVTYSLAEQIGRDLMYTFWIASVLLPMLSITSLRNGALQGMRYVVRAQIPETIIRPLILGILTGIIYLYLEGDFTAAHAMYSNIAAAGLAFVVGTYWLIKRLPREVIEASPEYCRKEWLKMSLPMFFIAGMNLLLQQTDIMMLGVLVGTDSTGIYGAAARIAALVTFGLTAVNSIVAPLISEYYSSGKMQELQRMITLAARGIFGFTILICACLFFFGEFILGLFGEDFIAGYPPLAVLLVGQAISAIAGSVGFLMVMTGHQMTAAKVIGGSALLNIVLNIILIPMYGIIGAAVATAISAATWNMIMLFYVKNNLNINSTVFAKLNR